MQSLDALAFQTFLHRSVDQLEAGYTLSLALGTACYQVRLYGDQVRVRSDDAYCCGLPERSSTARRASSTLTMLYAEQRGLLPRVELSVDSLSELDRIPVERLDESLRQLEEQGFTTVRVGGKQYYVDKNCNQARQLSEDTGCFDWLGSLFVGSRVEQQLPPALTSVPRSALQAKLRQLESHVPETRQQAVCHYLASWVTNLRVASQAARSSQSSQESLEGLEQEPGLSDSALAQLSGKMERLLQQARQQSPFAYERLMLDLMKVIKHREHSGSVALHYPMPTTRRQLKFFVDIIDHLKQAADRVKPPAENLTLSAGVPESLRQGLAKYAKSKEAQRLRMAFNDPSVQACVHEHQVAAQEIVLETLRCVTLLEINTRTAADLIDPLVAAINQWMADNRDHQNVVQVVSALEDKTLSQYVAPASIDRKDRPIYANAVKLEEQLLGFAGLVLDLNDMLGDAALRRIFMPALKNVADEFALQLSGRQLHIMEDQMPSVDSRSMLAMDGVTRLFANNLEPDTYLKIEDRLDRLLEVLSQFDPPLRAASNYIKINFEVRPLLSKLQSLAQQLQLAPEDQAKMAAMSAQLDGIADLRAPECAAHIKQCLDELLQDEQKLKRRSDFLAEFDRFAQAYFMQRRELDAWRGERAVPAPGRPGSPALTGLIIRSQSLLDRLNASSQQILLAANAARLDDDEFDESMRDWLTQLEGLTELQQVLRDLTDYARKLDDEEDELGYKSHFLQALDRLESLHASERGGGESANAQMHELMEQSFRVYSRASVLKRLDQAVRDLPPKSNKLEALENARLLIATLDLQQPGFSKEGMHYLDTLQPVLKADQLSLIKSFLTNVE